MSEESLELIETASQAPIDQADRNPTAARDGRAGAPETAIALTETEQSKKKHFIRLLDCRSP